MPVVLVDVHRSAEDQRRLEPFGRRRRLPSGYPFHHLLRALVRHIGEHPWAGVVFVDDREDAHRPEFHTRNKLIPRPARPGRRVYGGMR